MDKDTFIRHAPAYYALAIAVSMLANDSREVFTRSQPETSLGERYKVRISLEHPVLVAEGLRILEETGVAETISEAFGPALYRRRPELTEEWLFRGDHQIPIFRTYRQLQNATWLSDALADVNRRYVELSISPLDFDEPLPSLWEPLPLDRTDEKLLEATAKVDEALQKIAGDNGYAVSEALSPFD
jgi:hypothetical protein